MNRRIFVQSAAGVAMAVTTKSGVAMFDPQKAIGKAPSLVPNRPRNGTHWMMEEPTRMGWFQLRFTDAQTDPKAFVASAAEDLHMNAICVTFGGSYAFYPSVVEFHQWAPGISAQNDFMGTLVSEARRRKIRVGARFDFAKQSAETVKAHPEWFFTHADGGHSTDGSGRSVPCINGDFYHVKTVEILTFTLPLLEEYELASFT